MPHTQNNTVHHPPHYNAGSIEVIDAIDAWNLNFCLGNVVKYVARADHKNNPIEDLAKARWYLDREIQRRKGEIAAASLWKPSAPLGSPSM